MNIYNHFQYIGDYIMSYSPFKEKNKIAELGEVFLLKNNGA